MERIFQNADEQLDRREQLKAAGYDLDTLAREVAALFGINPSN